MRSLLSLSLSLSSGVYIPPCPLVLRFLFSLSLFSCCIGYQLVVFVRFPIFFRFRFFRLLFLFPTHYRLDDA